MAEHTRKVQFEDMPDYGKLTLELRYFGNKDMIASHRPMDEMSAEEQQRSIIERFAQHCIKSWSVGDYSPTSGLALLLKLQDEHPYVVIELFLLAQDKAAFKIPRLVDATDLGNE